MVRTYQCLWSASSEEPFNTCPVESGYVLVGGGAEIQGNNTAYPGGFLVASYPDNDPNRVGFIGNDWYVLSKDQYYTYPHRIRAYAIGLKLAGVSQASLENQVTFSTAETSGLSHNPGITVFVPDPLHELVLGGGGESVFSGYGQLLVTSRPDPNGPGWTVASKDDIGSDPGKVAAVVIGLPTCPVGYTGGCLAVGTTSSSVFHGTDYSTISVYPSTGVQVSIGGSTQWNNAGRMMTDLFPLQNSSSSGAEYISKDQLYVDSGTDTVYSMSLHKQ